MPITQKLTLNNETFNKKHILLQNALKHYVGLLQSRIYKTSGEDSHRVPCLVIRDQIVMRMVNDKEMREEG